MWYNDEMMSDDSLIPPGSSDPLPVDASASMPSLQPEDRKMNIQKAAEAGRARAEREQEHRQQVESYKKSETKREHTVMNEALEQAHEKKEEKKSFFRMKKQQERDAAEYKLRHEKELGKLETERQARDAKRKNQQKYMNEIHENARIKLSMEQQQNKLKAALEKERSIAEHNDRRKVEEAERLCTSKKEDAEKEARAKKAVEQSDLKTKLYQEERHFRASVSALDLDLRRLEQTQARTHQEHAQMMQAGLIQLRRRKKNLDDQHKENRETLERDAHQREHEVDGVMYVRKTQADVDLRQTIRQLECELARRNNDSEMTYRKRLGDSKL